MVAIALAVVTILFSACNEKQQAELTDFSDPDYSSTDSLFFIQGLGSRNPEASRAM